MKRIVLGLTAVAALVYLAVPFAADAIGPVQNTTPVTSYGIAPDGGMVSQRVDADGRMVVAPECSPPAAAAEAPSVE